MFVNTNQMSEFPFAKYIKNTLLPKNTNQIARTSISHHCQQHEQNGQQRQIMNKIYYCIYLFLIPHLHNNLEFRFGFVFCNSIEERKKLKYNNNKQNMEN